METGAYAPDRGRESLYYTTKVQQEKDCRLCGEKREINHDFPRETLRENHSVLKKVRVSDLAMVPFAEPLMPKAKPKSAPKKKTHAPLEAVPYPNFAVSKEILILTKPVHAQIKVAVLYVLPYKTSYTRPCQFRDPAPPDLSKRFDQCCDDPCVPLILRS